MPSRETRKCVIGQVDPDVVSGVLTRYVEISESGLVAHFVTLGNRRTDLETWRLHAPLELPSVMASVLLLPYRPIHLDVGCARWGY
ncbi:hypothetical protein GN244_ATG09386 [Phytophthora infestans]|uniref:Uncharacterized protein n=1 Tax=Phytophthora infestans TaxID=4787 RepID=A0A833WDT1_PHYIN|nr:hypothetical protein GN244_ATG09386 [Phytophthora infestans]